MQAEALKTITARTLVMAGEHDEILEQHTRLIADSIPDAEVLILKGEDHWLVRDNPDLFCKTILSFLQAAGKP